jgi:hypothetical protein
MYKLILKRVTFNNNKKIMDIKDLRTMLRNPATSTCPSLSLCKEIIEHIYEKGEAEVLVSEAVAAAAFSNSMDPEFMPDGWVVDNCIYHVPTTPTFIFEG